MEGVFVFIIIFNYYIIYKVIIYNVQGRKGWTVELLGLGSINCGQKSVCHLYVHLPVYTVQKATYRD